MKTNAVVTRWRGARAEAVIYRAAMLRREMLDDADVWVSDGGAASLLLFMSRRPCLVTAEKFIRGRLLFGTRRVRYESIKV